MQISGEVGLVSRLSPHPVTVFSFACLLDVVIDALRSLVAIDDSDFRRTCAYTTVISFSCLLDVGRAK